MADPGELPFVVSTTDAAFALDVFERSRTGLVVVDFWAEWCAPCRMLGPLLENLAQQYGGRFTLVKADTEQTPQAAQEFQVSGIPAVFAVLDGEVVDFFQGLLPEEAIRQWLDRLLEHAAVGEAQRLAAEDPIAAESQLRGLLGERPQDATLVVALATLLADQGRTSEARELVDPLVEAGYADSAVEKLKARLDLAANSALDLDAARQAAAAQPEDFAAQFALAQALAGKSAYPEALDICLDLVVRDRHGTGEEARKLMIDVFRVLPDDSELTGAYRRKLSAALY